MMKRLVLPLITIICFYAESIFVEFFPTMSFLEDRLLVPRFLLVVLTIMGIYYFRNVTLIYAAIFGLLYDVYFTGLIGAYLFLFPISVYIAAKLVKVLHVHLVTAGLISLITITLVETLMYGLNILLFNVQMTGGQFLSTRLLPTQLLNLLFFLLIIIPFSRWLQKRVKELQSE